MSSSIEIQTNLDFWVKYINDTNSQVEKSDMTDVRLKFEKNILVHVKDSYSEIRKKFW